MRAAVYTDKTGQAAVCALLLVPIRDYTKGIILYLCKGTQISEAELKSRRSLDLANLASSSFETLSALSYSGLEDFTHAPSLLDLVELRPFETVA